VIVSSARPNALTTSGTAVRRGVCLQEVREGGRPLVRAVDQLGVISDRRRRQRPRPAVVGFEPAHGRARVCSRADALPLARDRGDLAGILERAQQRNPPIMLLGSLAQAAPLYTWISLPLGRTAMRRLSIMRAALARSATTASLRSARSDRPARRGSGAYCTVGALGFSPRIEEQPLRRERGQQGG